MVKNIFLKLKQARRQVKVLLADSAFEQKILDMQKENLEKKERQKQEKSPKEKGEKGEFFPRPKKKVEDRTIKEHEKETHKSLEKQIGQDKWKEILKKNLILLEAGRPEDDVQIKEIEHMLMSILNQPGNTMEIKREKNFAGSILGGSDLLWMTNKKASLADELEKFKKLKEKEKRPDLLTKKDFSKEDLESLQEDISSREPKKIQSPYVGWKRETPEGKTIYKLSGPQLKVILDLYEKALQRRLQPQKTNIPKSLPKPLEQKKVKEVAPLSDSLSDEDLAGIDFENFGKTSSIKKARQQIKKAQDMLSTKK